eukprot:6179217-Pleurochrysis_carterae.AAC.1
MRECAALPDGARRHRRRLRRRALEPPPRVLQPRLARVACQTAPLALHGRMQALSQGPAERQALRAHLRSVREGEGRAVESPKDPLPARAVESM